MELSTKLQRFVEEPDKHTPYLVVDLDIVEANYNRLAEATDQSIGCFYSIKANPAKPLLRRLDELGARFEVASLGEIQQCLEAGIGPDKIHFGNSIKRFDDIAAAWAQGVRSFGFDSEQELLKLKELAPGAKVTCRLSTDGVGAVWGLCRKFGCGPALAASLLRQADELGMIVEGVSFHVGSQQQEPAAWDRALRDARSVYDELESFGIRLTFINLGGGLPSSGYLDETGSPKHFDIQLYGDQIASAREKNFGDVRGDIEFVLEPGRFIVGTAGCVKSQVILVTDRAFEGEQTRWIFLDVGKFNGLYEATDIKLQVQALDQQGALRGEEKSAAILAGPTCDSDDLLSPLTDAHQVSVDVDVQDYMLFPGTGAYSNSYTTMKFNGFSPLDEYYI